MSRPVLFFLPGLGMSAQVAAPLDQRLVGLDVVGIDLPGFGLEPMGSSTVDDLADHVITRIAAVVARRAPERWGLVGHSMGGKVASLVAARTLTGRAPLFGLAGVVLLAGSPPSPEPIDDVRRAEMLSWADGPGPGLSAEDARTFLDANLAAPLPADLDDLALTAVRGSDREAWTAWLTRGSREDLTEQVGRLDLPALLLAGAEDGDLGEAAQRELNGRVYPRAQAHVQVVEGAAHLLMLEQPAAVADAIAEWWRIHADRGPTVPTDYAAMLASNRTSRRTRAALARRAVADDPRFDPRALSEDQVSVLGRVAERVVPQDGLPAEQIDLAARVDAQLADGVGDGWRREGEPEDVVAYRCGLDALAAAGFAELDDAVQDQQLQALGDDPWFEDCRTDLVRAWLAHPATMARIGFDGVAGGGDDRRQQGFTLVALGRKEAWEPEMAPAVRRSVGETEVVR